MNVFKNIFYVLNHAFIKNEKSIIPFSKRFINLIFNYKICKKYLDLVLNINDISLKEEIINLLWKSKTIPSDYCFLFQLHSDIDYERFSIFAKSLEIHKKLKNLNKSDRCFFSKRFSKMKDEINMISTSPSFLAFKINLAIIYSYFGLKSNIYYYHDGINLYTKEEDKLNKFKSFILKEECKKISKKFKNIKIYFFENKNFSIKISKNLKKHIKRISIIDATSYNQIISLEENFKYKNIKDKIKDKKLLKERYISNLKFAFYIKEKIYKTKFWLIHNSNVGPSGILQCFINESKLNYSSHEFRMFNLDNRQEYKNFSQICTVKNQEVLNFEDKNIILDLLDKYDNNKIKLGSLLIEKNYKQNYKNQEEENFYLKNPELKKIDKSKIFLLLSNILSESKYSLNSYHTIFKNFKEFLVETISYFNKSNLKLIIKCHPAEFSQRTKYSDNLENIVKSKDSRNVTLIFSNNISSYSLTNLTNNIIVYDTDMGAEMNYFKKNVITCANASYNNFGITYFPKDKFDYFKIIEKISSDKKYFLNQKNFFNIDKKKSSLYWYYFNYELFKSFPFVYGDSTNQLIKNFDFFFSNKCEVKSKNLLFDLIGC